MAAEMVVTPWQKVVPSALRTEDGPSFSSLCYLLLLDSDLLPCLFLAGAESRLQLLNDGLLSGVLLALHLQHLSSVSPVLDLSLLIQQNLLQIPCSRYRFFCDNVTLSTRNGLGNSHLT